MATSLAATFQAGTGTDPARVLLQVTGAPSLTPPYSSNFATTVDGWTLGSGAASLTFNAGGSPATLRMLTNADAVYGLFNRTVTGLTVGQTYSFSLMAKQNPSGGQIRIGVSGIDVTAYFTPATRSQITYSFVATATSHIIYVQLRPYPPTIGSDFGDYLVDTVIVQRTSGWQGTKLYRTDANGSLVRVRTAPGQDATGTTGSATMTVTDYEAALTGAAYTVVDGNGVSFGPVSVAATPLAGLWFTLPTTSNPATPTPPTFVQATMVTGFDETSESNGSIHRIIGRNDPIVNPGPLLLRAGQLQVWCSDYAAAVALRDLLSTGIVAHVRQPSFARMDMYLVGTRVRIAPEDVTTSQRWMATIEYQEVARP